MGIHWDPKAMFHADLVKKSNLMGKTMDGGWLHPNGKYEKIPGHDGSGLQSRGFIPNFASMAVQQSKQKRHETPAGSALGRKWTNAVMAGEDVGKTMGLGRGGTESRATMPQLSKEAQAKFESDLIGGKGVAGEMLGGKKVKIAKGGEAAVKNLKATQKDIYGANVLSKLKGAFGERWNKEGPSPMPGWLSAPIMTSKDNKILDGHHRWATVYARDAIEDGVLGNLSMKTNQIGLPIQTLLKLSDVYSGAKQAGGATGAAGGLVPSFAALLPTSKMDWKEGDMHSAGGEVRTSAGALSYEETDDHLDIKYNKSDKKGAGFSQFKGLVEEAESKGKAIRSGNLINQMARMDDKEGELSRLKPFEQLAKHAYPQLRHRMLKGVKTSGSSSWYLGDFLAQLPEDDPNHGKYKRGPSNPKFKSLKELKSKANKEKSSAMASALVNNNVSVDTLTTTTGNKAGLLGRMVGRRGDDRGLLSGGLVPNFANPLMDAIGREKDAGVPVGKIRVGANKSLSSGSNPMGLGVFNTRDEPSGLGQGINRSKKMGVDPKSHGASSGFVPNFAERTIDIDPGGALDSIAALGTIDEASMGKLKLALDKLRVSSTAAAPSFEEDAVAAKKLAADMGLAGSSLDAFEGVVDNVSAAGKKLNKEMNTPGAKLKKMAGGVKDFFLSPAKDAEGNIKDVSGKMLGLSFAIPQVTETFKQFGGEMGQTSTALIDGVSGLTMTFSGLSTILPGPGGQLAAFIIAAGTSANKFAKDLQALGPDLKKAAEASKEKFQKLSNNLTAYAQTFSELQKAAADYNTPAKAIMRLQDKLLELAESIPSDLGFNITTITDPEEMQDKIAEAIAKQGKINMQLQAASDLQGGLDSENSLMTGMAKMLFGDLGDEMAREMKRVFDGAEGQLRFDRLIADARKGLDFKSLAESSLNAAEAQNLATQSNGAFINSLGESYGASEDFQLVLRQLSESEMKDFREALMSSARAAQRQKEAMERVAKVKEEKSDQLGLGALQRSISVLSKNVEMEAVALLKLGGGLEAFKDPDKLDPLFTQVRQGAQTLATTKPGNINTEEGRRAAVERGQGALGLSEGLFEQGMFIPQLDELTGELDSTGKEFRGQIMLGMEMAFRKNAGVQLKFLNKQKQKAIDTGGDTTGIDAAIKGIEKLTTTKEGGALLKRGFKKQVDDRFGIEEMKLKDFTLGTVETTATPLAPGQVRDPAEQQRIDAQADTSTLRQSLAAQGVTDSKQIAILIKSIERRLKDEKEKAVEAKAKADAEGDTDESTRLQGVIANLDAQLDRSGSGIMGKGADITLSDLRDIKGASGEQVIAGRRNAISLSGEGESPAQRALREANDNLRKSTDLLREAVQKAAKDEGTAESSTVAKEAADELKKKAGSGAEGMMADLIKARGEAGVLTQDSGGGGFWMGGGGGDALRGVSDFFTDGSTDAASAEMAADSDAMKASLGKLSQIVSTLKQQGSITESGDLRDLDSSQDFEAIKIAAAKMEKMGRSGRNTTDSTLANYRALNVSKIDQDNATDGLSEIGKTIALLQANALAGGKEFKMDAQTIKLMRASFGESQNKEATQNKSFLDKSINYAKESSKSGQTREKYLNTMQNWNNPGTAAVTIHGDKIGLIAGIKHMVNGNGALIKHFQVFGKILAKNDKGRGLRMTQEGSMVAAGGMAGGGALTAYGAKKGYNRVNYGAFNKGNRTRNLVRGMSNPLPGVGPRINDMDEATRRLKKVKKPGTGNILGMGKERMFSDADIAKIFNTEDVAKAQSKVTSLKDSGKGGWLQRKNPFSEISKAIKELKTAQTAAIKPIIQQGTLGQGWKTGVAEEGQRIIREAEGAEKLKS